MQHSKRGTISEVLGRMSFRNGLGYATFFLLVMLPTADAWQSGSESVSYESQFGSRADFRYRNLPTRRGGQLSVRERMNRSWWPGTSWLMWLFAKTSLAVLGATLSLMILMPFRGCKRYAILFGPPMGLSVVTAVGIWLAGRQEIYRFEPVVVAVIAALPTASLWFLLCKWAYESRHAAQPIVLAEVVPDHPSKR